MSVMISNSDLVLEAIRCGRGRVEEMVVWMRENGAAKMTPSLVDSLLFNLLRAKKVLLKDRKNGDMESPDCWALPTTPEIPQDEAEAPTEDGFIEIPDESPVTVLGDPIVRQPMELARELAILVDRVRPFPGQPRTFFDKDKLYRLSLSIKTRGQRVPITVRAVQNRSYDYVIVDGERRWRACKLASVATVRGLVRQIRTAEHFEHSVTSNFGRADHTPLEIAAAIKRIKEESPEKLTVEEIAARFAKSTAWVFNYLTLVDLDPRVKALMDPSLPEDKQLKLSLAITVARIPDVEHQIEAARHIVDNQLSVAEAKLYLVRSSKRTGFEIKKRTTGRDSHGLRRSLKRFVANLSVSSEVALSLGDGDFHAVLSGESFFDVRDLAEQLDQSMGRLAEMSKRLRAIAKGKAARIAS